MIGDNLLFSSEDFEPYRTIFDNVDFEEKVAPYLREAQELDLRPALGAALYRDLIKNKEDQIYIDLLNGVEYEYRGEDIAFEGLRPVLVYWAYARYIRSANVTNTAAGLVTKNTNESTPVSEKTIGAMISQANSSAVSYLNEAIVYLNEKRTTYPLWKCSSNAKRKTGIRITSVGGNSSEYSSPHGATCQCDECLSYL